jgi:murein DD-endopeptidase MepM/ murein hydrolase activator NlpD
MATRDTLSVIVVSDETAPVRRFELRRDWIRRGIWGAAVVAVLLLALCVDYVRMRIDNTELRGLRAETIERRQQVADFQKTLDSVDGQLAILQEFERKVRIIANLPGTAGTGGAEITAVGSRGETSPGGSGGLAQPLDAEVPARPRESRLPPVPESADEQERVSVLRDAAVYLGAIAEGQSANLRELVDALEGKHDHLASSPSIWPAKGWLTSRYGSRVSPFTGKSQFHAGIDIAGAKGTDIVAPARGKVVFSGKRGPLGNSLIIDHGHGVRTQYGHNDELLVKRGATVERGEVIARLGNSGRSTGPHLHYVVEVRGKTRDPLDYIFD